MNESSGRRAVIVGIFILVGILLLVAGVLAIGNLRNTFSSKMEITAVFDDVNGLQKGNNIWFSGVKIGTIKTVRFLGKSHVKVVLNVDQSAKEYIRKDARVRISTDGLIGNKIVIIMGGTYRAGPITEGDTLHVDKTLSPEELMGVLQENNKNLLDITGNVKEMTGQLRAGKGNLGRLMKDESLYEDLASAASSLKSTSMKANQAISSIAEFSSRLNRKGTLAYELGNDTTVFRQLRGTADRLRMVSDTASIAVTNLKRATENRRTPVGVLLHDEQAGANLKTILKNLSSGSKKLDEDLEAMQHSFLLRKYFRKKGNSQP
jgi:phospholipid/cholesterol/gamma-HCH transport system substrate-binding protein